MTRKERRWRERERDVDLLEKMEKRERERWRWRREIEKGETCEVERKQEIMEEKGEVGRNERLQIPGSW